MSDSINAIKINTCGQLNRPDMSLLSLYYHVSGQSSSANEKGSYFVLMNISEKGSYFVLMNISEKGSYFVLINIHKKWSHDR